MSGRGYRFRELGRTACWLSCIICLILLGLDARGDEPVDVSVKAMLVGTDLSLKPVPKHVMQVVKDDDAKTDVAELTTSFSGEASLRLEPGQYRIRSVEPVRFEDRTFSWDVPITVAQDGMTVELSNDNAKASEAKAAAAGVFDAVEKGVVTLESEGGEGTAFLVDDQGLLLTNDHVVEGSRFFAIRVSAKERYAAKFVFSNPTEDIAVVRVHPDVAAKLTILALAPDSPEKATAETGAEVFAVGSPLNQEKIITSGIVSKVETGAIISDVMIDHGNSGGPLLNGDAQVLGINTFGEGRGVSGIIRIWKAFPVLEEAKKRTSGMDIPLAEMLPPYPDTRYPADALKGIALAKEFDLTDYRIRTSPFDVYFLTPPASVYYQLRDQIEASEGRKKRRRRQRVETQDTYDPAADIRGWREYVGESKALVQVVVEPRVKATLGSSIAAGLVGVAALTKYRYAGDFDSLKLTCDGQEIPFIRVSRAPRQCLFKAAHGHMEDVAYVGFAEFPPDHFDPSRCAGKEVVLEVVNEAKPDKTIRKEIPQDIIDRIWQDFAPLRVPASAVTPENSSGE